MKLFWFLPAIVGVVFLWAQPVAFAFLGSINYTDMTVQELKSTIRKMNSQITAVEISNDKGKEFPIIIFKAGVVKDPLLSESKALKDIAQKIATTKGAERFSGVYFILQVPVVDAQNNKHDARALDMFWTMETLRGINWKGFQNWQFLNLIDAFSAEKGIGENVVKAYCGSGESYARGFCRRVEMTE